MSCAKTKVDKEMHIYPFPKPKVDKEMHIYPFPKQMELYAVICCFWILRLYIILLRLCYSHVFYLQEVFNASKPDLNLRI